MFKVEIVFTRSATANLFGVVTKIDLSGFISEAIVKYASPVPGGISIKRKSNSPQIVDSINCLIAPLSIGPLHTAALFASKIKPIELIDIPLNITGSNIFLSPTEIKLGLASIKSNNIC